MKIKTGIELIAEERERQVSQEGYTPEHDDRHLGGELADAAAVYADAAGAMARGASPTDFFDPNDEDAFNTYLDGDGPEWPFEPKDLKLSPDPVRNLVKAGALIAAEIDRLRRVPKSRGSTPIECDFCGRTREAGCRCEQRTVTR